MAERCDAVRGLLGGGPSPADVLLAARRAPSRFMGVLAKAVARFPHAKTSDRMLANAEVEEPLKCEECDATFPTRQQLLSHRHKRHGYANPLRAKNSGPA